MGEIEISYKDLTHFINNYYKFLRRDEAYAYYAFEYCSLNKIDYNYSRDIIEVGIVVYENYNTVNITIENFPSFINCTEQFTNILETEYNKINRLETIEKLLED